MDFSYVWLLATTMMLIHQHQASTDSAPSPTAEEGPLAQLPHTAHRREKRCSCDNQKDKECIFFCHIGIVWVNSPSHVVPYGFGSVRLRRELGRCSCTDTQDAKCVSFCSAHTPTQNRAREARHTPWRGRYTASAEDVDKGTVSVRR